MTLPLSLRTADREAALLGSAAALALVAAGFAAALALDPRAFGGDPQWLKPFKFAVSAGIQLASVALLLAPLPAESRRASPVRLAVAAMLVASWFEVGWIGWRAALGQPSHFAPDPLGAAMFGLMAAGAAVLTLAPAVLGAIVLARGAGPWRFPAGLSLLVGGLLGFVTGAAIGIAGGSLIGDATQRLPLVGWSASGGDLRIAHFAGVHALQVLPLAAVLMHRWQAGWRNAALVAVAIGLTGLTAWLMARALAGLPPI